MKLKNMKKIYLEADVDVNTRAYYVSVSLTLYPCPSLSGGVGGVAGAGVAGGVGGVEDVGDVVPVPAACFRAFVER